MDKDNDPSDKPTNSLDRAMPTRDTPEINGDRRANGSFGSTVPE